MKSRMRLRRLGGCVVSKVVVGVSLEANQVPIFVDTAPSGIHNWGRVPLSTVPALEGYLREHYALVAVVEGSRVYRRVPVQALRQ